MKYKCLRTCYVGDVLWKEGETYELPDNIAKSPKNFSPLEVVPDTSTETETIPETKPKRKYRKRKKK